MQGKLPIATCKGECDEVGVMQRVAPHRGRDAGGRDEEAAGEDGEADEAGAGCGGADGWTI
jgi:hypothetical protein